MPLLAVARDTSSTTAISPDDERVGHLKLHAIRQHLGELAERAGLECGLRTVVAGQRMGAHHRPVDIVGDMAEESVSLAMLEIGKDPAHHLLVKAHANTLPTIWFEAAVIAQCR